mgnify:CR=1 FL=1
MLKTPTIKRFATNPIQRSIILPNMASGLQNYTCIGTFKNEYISRD